MIENDNFCKHEGFDLASLRSPDLATFRVPKTDLYSTLKSQIARHFKVGEDQFRLWVLVKRQNKTIRTDVPISDDKSLLGASLFHLCNSPDLIPADVETIRSTMANKCKDLILYLDVGQEVGQVRSQTHFHCRPPDVTCSDYSRL